MRGFYLQRSKGTPQTLVILRIAYCPRIRSAISRSILKPRPWLFFAESREPSRLSAILEFLRVEGKKEAGKWKRWEEWKIREVQFFPSIAITPASFLCINTLPSKLGRNPFHIVLFQGNLASVITLILRPDSVHIPAWIRPSWIISLVCDSGLDPNSGVRHQNLSSQQSAAGPQRTRLYERHPGPQRQLQVNHQRSGMLLCSVRGPCIN